MILTTPKQPYSVHFTHAPIEVYSKHPNANGSYDQLADRGTICTIHPGRCISQTRPCGTPNIEVGISTCSFKDAFSRYKGRKYAFTRAISKYPRALRAILWADFNQKNPFPKENK